MRPPASPVTPILGEVIELMYPETLGRDLADFIGIRETQLRHYVKTRRLLKGRNRKPIGYRTTYNKIWPVVKVNDEAPQQHRRFAFVHVLEWEKKNGRRVPADHVLVNLDGDRSNTDPSNLHCMPRSQLLRWAQFVRYPVEVHVVRLTRKIMALDTSEKVKKQLLDILEDICDPDKKPDLLRQRAACETVQTLVGLLRVEVAYLEAIEGDGVIPFLEEARIAAVAKRDAARKRRSLPHGPAADHPWRGLGAPGTT